jgi:hypothetical protein
MPTSLHETQSCISANTDIGVLLNLLNSVGQAEFCWDLYLYKLHFASVSSLNDSSRARTTYHVDFGEAVLKSGGLLALEILC